MSKLKRPTAPTSNAKGTRSPKRGSGENNFKKTSKVPATKTPERHFRENTKLATVIGMLRAAKGATIEELSKATRWQAHSVRGALSGAIKTKLGLNITSTKTDGIRTYRISD